MQAPEKKWTYPWLYLSLIHISSVSGICLYAGYLACIGRLGSVMPFIPIIGEAAPVARLCIGLVVLGVLMGVLAGGVFIRKHLEI